MCGTEPEPTLRRSLSRAKVTSQIKKGISKNDLFEEKPLSLFIQLL